ncbi:GNAT family N-acetyltransferase [Marinitenerispora sediminis]|uniref:GNAT family N-acetyltransferase n=1 Tax=Marinitenerispora sediminis TaxID=1931232 RepID=A0A368T067_9ACTN|nr:GNAT family N-acetyltransferase [Marinitenerispora sediminis]RCV49386.1 GNAT family N-acetyltransferase [Marinitenerispora sediminis]RCV51977.1 GNAT family N-acetyltransferase [Marinitenerispora sediminis]RCV52098.1 GNAT family N-acetyltransferase [Marinitenerispora sediminis]
MEARHWPMYDLRIRTPRLELRLPLLSELDDLAELATEGVHDPAVMPFGVPWTDAEPDEVGRGVMQYHWRMLGACTPGDWRLPLAVFLDGRIVGTQELAALDFAVLREVRTGSWLGRRYQGRGIGSEMRAAVLDLAFVGLGAEAARSTAMSDNPASLGVSRRLGYRPDGTSLLTSRNRPAVQQRLLLSRDDWEKHRTVPVELAGLERCLPLLGA